MRFTAILTAVALITSGVQAAPSPAPEPSLLGLGGSTLSNTLKNLIGFDLSFAAHFNAPSPPWVKDSLAGWVVTRGDWNDPRIPCLRNWICTILRLFPLALQCPTLPPTPTGSNPPGPTEPTLPGYTNKFFGLTGATQADGYLTFGLVDTVADCRAMCQSVQACKFFNTYHDVNGKDGSPLLTCSLYDRCLDATTATNTGGQTQSNGLVNYITDSEGWCKV